jgi:hypothetical protein
MGAVTAIANANAFTNCNALETVIATSLAVTTNFPMRATLKEVDLSAIQEIPANFFESCAATLEKVTIAGATAIGEDAFKDCASLTRIIAPAITNLADLPIADNTATLAELDISGVTALAQDDLADCPNLASVKLGITGPTAVDAGAFSGTTAQDVTAGDPPVAAKMTLLVPAEAAAAYAAWLADTVSPVTNADRIEIKTYDPPAPPAPPEA